MTRWGIPWSGAALVLTAVFLLSSCAFFKLEQSKDDDGNIVLPPGQSSGGGEDIGDACGFQSDSAQCNSCAENWCCDEAQWCVNNSDCLSLDTCIAACGMDGGCVDGCNSTFAAGVADLDSFYSCITGWCFDECIQPADAGGACGYNDPYADCTQCIDRACCSESLACFQNPSCSNLYTCIVGCGSDEFCASGCFDSHFEGVNPLVDFLNCSEMNCGWECGF